MTVLRLVDDSYQPLHSVRVTALTDENLADLEWLATNVLRPSLVACRELHDALDRRDRDGSIVACRKLLAHALVGADKARDMERGL